MVYNEDQLVWGLATTVLFGQLCGRYVIRSMIREQGDLGEDLTDLGNRIS